jgi:hypothetical protein
MHLIPCTLFLCPIIRPATDNRWTVRSSRARPCARCDASVSDDSNLLELIKKIQAQVTRKIGVKPDYLIPVEKSAIEKTAIGKIQAYLNSEKFAKAKRYWLDKYRQIPEPLVHSIHRIAFDQFRMYTKAPCC